STWTNLANAATPVADGTLATWDTASLADGEWELQLTVTDTLGLVGTSRVRTIVDNVAPFASVTTPVHIQAAQGGDIFTTGSEIHLYLPPKALDQDAVVHIDVAGDPTLATSLPGGGPRVGPAWDLGWEPARLTRGA